MSQLLSVNFTVSSFSVVCLSREVFVLYTRELCSKQGQYMNIFKYKSFISQTGELLDSLSIQEERAFWFPDLSVNHTGDLE